MSRNRENTGTTQKPAKRQGNDIELIQVIGALKVVGIMSGGLLVLSLILFLLTEKSMQSYVIYTMVIVINLIACTGSLLAVVWLSKKDEKLNKAEKERFEKKFRSR